MEGKMTLDCIIHGGYVVTMEGPGTGVIPRGAVGIKDQKIAAVGEEDSAQLRPGHPWENLAV